MKILTTWNTDELGATGMSVVVADRVRTVAVGAGHQGTGLSFAGYGAAFGGRTGAVSALLPTTSVDVAHPHLGAPPV